MSHNCQFQELQELGVQALPVKVGFVVLLLYIDVLFTCLSWLETRLAARVCFPEVDMRKLDDIKECVRITVWGLNSEFLGV